MRHPLPLAFVLSAVTAAGALAQAPAAAPVPESVALKKSCDKGGFEDCHTLATAYRRGEKGVAKDASKAAGLLKKACEGGHAQSCLDLGDMHREGEGVAKDVEKTLLY